MLPGLVDNSCPWLIYERKLALQKQAKKAERLQEWAPCSMSGRAPLSTSGRETRSTSVERTGSCLGPAPDPEPASNEPLRLGVCDGDGEEDEEAGEEEAGGDETTSGESREETLAEFKRLLIRAGKTDGKTSSGIVSKYTRYMKLLFVSGTFTCRSDFFSEGAEQRATAVYEGFARRKRSASTSNISERKYFTNFMHGFKDFVILANREV